MIEAKAYAETGALADSAIVEPILLRRNAPATMEKTLALERSNGLVIELWGAVNQSHILPIIPCVFSVMMFPLTKLRSLTQIHCGIAALN